jgi:ketosteroid isomerase-like protein
MRLTLPLLLVAALAASCASDQGASPLDTATVKASADSLWTQFAAAADQHDAIGFGAIFNERSLLLFDGAPTIVGRDSIQSYLVSRYADFDATGFGIRPDELKVSGTLGVQIGSFEERGARNGKPETRYRRYVMVLERGADKRWLVSCLSAMTDSIRASDGVSHP